MEVVALHHQPAVVGDDEVVAEELNHPNRPVAVPLEAVLQLAKVHLEVRLHFLFLCSSVSVDQLLEALIDCSLADMVMMMIISELQKLAFQKASSHLFHFGFGRLTQGEVAAFEKAEDGSKGVREEELGVKGVPGTGEPAVEESAKREERIENDFVFRIKEDSNTSDEYDSNQNCFFENNGQKNSNTFFSSEAWDPP